MHTVAVLALDQVIPFDLSTPIEVFSRTRLPDGRPGYQVRVCAEHDEIDAGAFTLRPPWSLEGLQDADDHRAGHHRSHCLAASRRTRRATVGRCRRHADRLHLRRHPSPWLPPGSSTGCASRPTGVRPGFWPPPTRTSTSTRTSSTSTTASSSPPPALRGQDLCLHMIRRDYGSAVAADVARLSVMPLEREGGQAQFIVHDHVPTPQGSELEALLAWLRENPGPRPRPRRHRRAGRYQHPNPDPALPRPDRHHPAPVAAPSPHPPGAAPPRNHGALRRTTSAARSASAHPPPSVTASNAPPASPRRPTDARSAELGSVFKRSSGW